MFSHGDRIRYETVGDDGFPLVRYGFVGGSADEGGPVVVMLDGEIGGDVVDVAWIGAARALQVRADELVAWTTPHTMREQSAAQVPATEVASLPTVLVRSIRETPAVPELASFRLERGDRLLFVQGSGFEADANAYARAARAASAEQAATEAVALGSGQEVFVSAVCLERA